MYFYIYDSFLNSGKYRKKLERIEVRLGDFGIQGKIKRLNILHHQKEAIEESIRRGAKTIVLVGDDRTITQAIDTMAKQDVALGIIPIGDLKANRISRALGIPPEELACEVLSRRIIARLDLGKVGAHHFLTSAEVRATTFHCVFPGKAFRVEPVVAKTHLTIMNLARAPEHNERMIPSNPRDGILELVISDATRSLKETLLGNDIKKIPSIFPIQTLDVTEPEGAIMELDGCRAVKLPATVSVVPQKLRIIVGRERLFV